MIDLLLEQPIPLVEAARECPRRRRGRPTHVSCLYRWTTSGCRGVVLESVQIGGTRCTTREAMARFFEALTFGVDDHQRVRSPSKRQRAADHAIEALRREAI
jgi:hypothetical protein